MPSDFTLVFRTGPVECVCSCVFVTTSGFACVPTAQPACWNCLDVDFTHSVC